MTAADLARQAGLDRVAAWWPKGVDRDGQEPAEVSFTRGAVGLLEQFASAKDAGQVLSAVYRFTVWLVSVDAQLEPAQAFTPEVLAAYRAQVLSDEPRGTQDATCSRIRRVIAAVAAEPARAAEACRQVSQPSAITEAKDRVQAAAVERLIETYVPEGLAPDRWVRVRPVVLEAARSIQPATRNRTVVVLMRCAYLAAWVDSTERALRLDVVFHPDNIEEFAGVLRAASASHGSAATTVSTVRAVSQALYPDLAPASWTHFGRRSAQTDAYSPEGLAALVRQLGRERSPLRRRHLSSLIWLVLTTGARDGEQNLVRIPEDVSRAPDGTVTVALTRPMAGQGQGPTRQVVALADYADLLWDAIRDSVAHGDRWLTGGGPSRANRSSNLCLDTVGSWKPALDVGRLRRTYLVSLMAKPHTVPELLAAAGVSTLAALDPLVDQVRSGTQRDRTVDGDAGSAGATVVALAPEEALVPADDRRATDEAAASGDQVAEAS